MLTAQTVVGIGASAGGLNALQLLLAALPTKTGLAFVVVQHLAPDQPSILPELLQRSTILPVLPAAQGLKLLADHIYVNVPNHSLTIVDGCCLLSPPSQPHTKWQPIDQLFCSLALGYQQQSVGVVLSGMGADGSAGLAAIQAAGGFTLAQQPATALFAAMPEHAIAAGVVDKIAAADQLATALQQHSSLKNSPQLSGQTQRLRMSAEPIVATPDNALLQPILQILQQQTKHDFSQYKPSTLQRRIERRMMIHHQTELADYIQLLQKNPQEAELLFKELLIGVTGFFRDAAVWQQLSDKVLPELLQSRQQQKQLRAWVVGCSTGEEAYTLAMCLIEATEAAALGSGSPDAASPVSWQIFASDLSADAIATARRGIYPLSIADTVSEARLARFFKRQQQGYQIKTEIRDMVLFAQHNVLQAPPFTRLDLISCRNLLIYFDAALQRKLLPLFHYALRPAGVLLLGSSETVGRDSHLFTPIDGRLRLFVRQDLHQDRQQDRRQQQSRNSAQLIQSFPPLSTLIKDAIVTPVSPANANPDSLQHAADQLLLQVYAPAAVVVNPDGDIIYISGRTGKYLEPAAGKANWNIHAMARDGLRGPLSTVLKKAAAQTTALQFPGLEIQQDGAVQRVDVTVQALAQPAALQGLVLIVFRDVAVQRQGNRRGSKAGSEKADAQELAKCLDEMQSLREEARLGREELQSANEELQSTNEELQSTNEELTTSKEEMQSMNEELQTINGEMQSKLDDLALAQSDLKNLLNSIEIAILFLDQDLNVRRYTNRAARIINLRDSDVGRPLSDLTSSLQYPQLHQDALQTLQTLVFSEKQIETSDKRRFTVRIMPYRRLDNVIDGVVITFLELNAGTPLLAQIVD
ncbi:chemotaxis protein CheB [Rheinheimera sp. SA_1]|uniref:CheR family methyltransferase n=1 Tax=Rheinheimera sp. SA_1 TaxID=1827365 RepID=UPI0007FE896F|nr:CheR family methyltransferase [Rheinheimera sp. SA_1]OBP13655.1 chemotaxis protein CheB [Rheinheimera sp. SA_1]